MLPVLDQLAMLPVPIWAAIIAAMTALTGVFITVTVTRGQLKVQQQTLFATLLPRRIEWLDSFKKAVHAADMEMADIVFSRSAPPVPEGMFRVNALVADSFWLFDGEVGAAAVSVQEHLQVLMAIRVKAASGEAGAGEAASKVGLTVLVIYGLVSEVAAVARPFLFVGDIRRPKTALSAEARRALRMSTRVKSSRQGDMPDASGGN